MRASCCAAAVLVALAATAGMPAAAQDTRAAGGIEAWDGERGFVELERLQAEVRMLRMLAGAQEALLAWNRERAESGGGPAVLPAALCAEPEIGAWCRTLPATFGPDAGRTAVDERKGDGER